MAKNYSSKEFNKVVRSANSELKGTFKSPFVIVNLLNKAVKGDFEKVSGVEGLSRESLTEVARVLKSMYKGRYAFDLNIFEKDYLNRFCTATKYKGEETVPDYFEVGGVSCLVNVDQKGREVLYSDTDKSMIFLQPIPLTITGVFNAFAKVAKIDLKRAEDNEKAVKKAAKDNEKAVKRAKKQAENRAKELSLMYFKGQISELEFSEELAKIKVG